MNERRSVWRGTNLSHGPAERGVALETSGSFVIFHPLPRLFFFQFDLVGMNRIEQLRFLSRSNENEIHDKQTEGEENLPNRFD